MGYEPEDYTTGPRGVLPTVGETIQWAEVADRGLLVGTFVAQDGDRCSIQESSLATESCIWLGCNEFQRMHLTIENVQALLPHLLSFTLTGHLLPDATANEVLGYAKTIKGPRKT